MCLTPPAFSPVVMRCLETPPLPLIQEVIVSLYTLALAQVSVLVSNKKPQRRRVSTKACNMAAAGCDGGCKTGMEAACAACGRPLMRCFLR